MFVHLHSHSHYSFRDAGLRVSEYVRRVKDLGMPACALTEHGNMHSVYEFYNECKKHGIKPIFGTEAYVIPTKEMAESDDPAIAHIRYHLTLLCKDNIGYHQLIKAVTEAQSLQDKNRFPRMTDEMMARLFVGGHVIALSGCVQGEIPTLLLADEYEKAKERALYYQELFGRGNYYLELQDHGLEMEKKVIPGLIRISEETGIPLVATNDCHYANPEDAKVRDFLVAMRFGQKVNDPKFESDTGELYVKSEKEMRTLFPTLPEAIDNTLVIAEQCKVEFEPRKVVPHFVVPDGLSEADYLRQEAYRGLKQRYPDWESRPELTERLERELDVITKLNYAGYLLIVADFINYGRTFDVVGPGRGSAVGSLVCYVLGITDVDPIRYGLLFERFLNEDRISDPDIDSDFPPSTRDQVIDYVRKKYGEDSVCGIVTFGTLKARAAIRSAGRVTGVPQALCDRIAKMIPERPDITLQEAFDEIQELRDEYNSNPEAKTLFDNAKALEGLAVQSGVHAAGVIIADRDVSNYVPLLYDAKKDAWVAQFDKDTLERDCGLLKMDFLGLKNLDIISGSFKDIERIHGAKLSFDKIPLNDTDVLREIYAKGNTAGIFQFESEGMVSLLRRFQPESIDDLILLNAAYRPGPMQYLNDIIEVRHGRKSPEYICPQMESILKSSYGKPIFQEQIMQIINEVAGFSLGVADIVRRCMAKKDEEELVKYLPQIEEGLVKAGAKPSAAKQFCVELIDFSRYAFNKSHAAAYAILSYYTGWLKYHYPTIYMANLLSHTPFSKLPLYIKECGRMGIPVLPPSINESGRSFTPTSRGILFGLQGIKHVASAFEDIIANRPYASIRDYIERLQGSRAIYKQVLESLAASGAFDEFGLTRKQLVLGSAEYAKLVKKNLEVMANPKSRESTKEKWSQALQDFKFPDCGEFDKLELLEREKEVIGFYASGHPLDDYVSFVEAASSKSIAAIEEADDGKELVFAGRVNDIQILHRRSDGAPMSKVTLEDLTGELECVCFVRQHAEYKDLLKEGSLVVVKGNVEVEISDVLDEDDEPELMVQLIVKEVKPLDVRRKIVYIAVQNMRHWNEIRSLVLQCQGSDELRVKFRDQNRLRECKFGVRADLMSKTLPKNVQMAVI